MKISLVLLALLLAWLSPLQCQEKKAAKPDPVFEQVADVPGLPRVLLIGDSISMGYTLHVRKLFAGVANVHRIPENGGDTANGLAKIDKWLTVNGSNKWDIIHCNWGLHDIKLIKEGHQVEPDQYGKNLRELFKKMRPTGAKMIFAMTTPVPEGKVSPPRKNEDVILYNKIALKVMDDERIYLSDLYEAALAKQKDWQRSANVHFNEAGSKGLAESVHKVIKERLDFLKTIGR